MTVQCNPVLGATWRSFLMHACMLQWTVLCGWHANKFTCDDMCFICQCLAGRDHHAVWVLLTQNEGLQTVQIPADCRAACLHGGSGCDDTADSKMQTLCKINIDGDKTS